jgi:hypothetical protein
MHAKVRIDAIVKVRIDASVGTMVSADVNNTHIHECTSESQRSLDVGLQCRATPSITLRSVHCAPSAA